MNRRNLRSLP
ncbi:hypothetical protein AKJ16_DCAP08836 [Drosera capensis]